MVLSNQFKMLTKILLLGCCIIGAFGDDQNATDTNTNIYDIPLKISEFATVSGRTYYIHVVSTMSHPKARVFCHSLGKALVSIETKAINDKLYQTIGDKVSNKQASFWTSGEKIGDIWYWTSNGKPFSFTSWAPGEPNDADGREHCVEASYQPDKYHLLWNDLKCDAERYVVCEDL
ncbi:C-type lectin mosGCTL-1 [Leptinotarsa decemlineata]|uniref:C-type lectin mosGCTL-1 n=1 Tax=Leptinotarsa decemlineata TaxID=7539 RepID=UPI000C2534B7|nr:ladderlectin-like [Leptinotarsa decemlineata]